MQHPDDEHLARLALDPGPTDVGLTQHLEGCPTCREEVDELRDLADLARHVRSERLEPPPPQVWQGVVDELGLIGSRAPRRTRPLAWAAAAAVVGLGVGALGTWAVVRPDDPASAEVVRTAALEPLPDGGGSASGTARLLEGDDGSQTVQVSAPGLGAADGYFEVWLIRPGSDRMVSLGVLSADEAEFTVPATALDEGFTLVDVSDEPDDGEPTHSGDSVLRGDLEG